MGSSGAKGLITDELWDNYCHHCHTTVPLTSSDPNYNYKVLFKSHPKICDSLHICMLVYRYPQDCFKSISWSIIYHVRSIVWALYSLLHVLNDFSDYAAHCYVHKLNILLIPAKCVLSSSKPYLAIQTPQLCFLCTQKKTPGVRH